MATHDILSPFVQGSSSITKEEDTSGDESTDSMSSTRSSTYTCLPESLTDWKLVDILKWILELYKSENYSYEDLDLNYFKKLDGSQLMNLTETEWEQIDKKWSKSLYENVQKLKKLSYTCCRKHKKRNLFEFLRDLLLNPKYCPSLIRWENHEEGIFRLVRGDKVANIWGLKWGNGGMTYEKLSRIMRYYYKDKVLLPVMGRRLHYKFGPNAVGWRTNNPNFEN